MKENERQEIVAMHWDSRDHLEPSNETLSPRVTRESRDDGKNEACQARAVSSECFGRVRENARENEGKQSVAGEIDHCVRVGGVIGLPVEGHR